MTKKRVQNSTSAHSDRAPQMNGVWQLQTAKARFSEVFRLARNEGPQHITRQGKEAVVMISKEEYEELARKSHQPKSLVQFLRESPLAGIDLDLQRSKDKGRRVDL
jgi:antitoxin Phd